MIDYVSGVWVEGRARPLANLQNHEWDVTLNVSEPITNQPE